MASITAILNLQAGSGSLSISHADFPSLTMIVSDISDIKGEFDLVENSENANSVFFDIGGIEFSVFDSLSDNSSLLGVIDGLLTTDIITARLQFTTDGGLVIDETYEFTKNDVSFNRTKREITIEASVIVPTALDQTIQDFFNILDPAVIETFNPGTPFDAIDAKTFIDNVLPLLNSNSNNRNSSSNFSVNGKTVSETYLIVDGNSASTTTLREILFEMAAVEASIIGSFMGTNFFVARDNSTTGVVNLNEDMPSDFEFNLGTESFAQIAVTLNINGGGSWNDHTSTHSQIFNQDAENDFNVIFNNNVMAFASWNTNTNEYEDIGGSDSSVARDGVDGYAAAFGADGTRRGSITIFDVDRLNPSNGFRLESDFVPASAVFRPSDITYNLVRDIIDIDPYYRIL